MSSSDKRAYQAFRVRQFAGPHPALAAGPAAAAAAAAPRAPPAVAADTAGSAAGQQSEQPPRGMPPAAGAPAAAAAEAGMQAAQLCEPQQQQQQQQPSPDAQRVILHFDVDAFYAQVRQGLAATHCMQPTPTTLKQLLVHGIAGKGWWPLLRLTAPVGACCCRCYGLRRCPWRLADMTSHLLPHQLVACPCVCCTWLGPSSHAPRCAPCLPRC
jgi:hypothetical protein